MARIEEIISSSIPAVGHTGFKIIESHPEPGEYQLVSPDIATCDACRQEVFYSEDRRYRYPFTNCTNCGPRFTIIEDIPYDRPLTTMKQFTMCPACRKEYDDPLDRRFHAQPNACPECGPSLSLVDARGVPVKSKNTIQSAANLLREGKIRAASESAPARIVVAGGASFMTDQFFSAGNQALTLNVMDWLVRDDALLAVRSRGLRAAPLRQVSESTRRSVKYANVLGLPALCVGFGLVRWRRRESRRTRVSV